MKQLLLLSLLLFIYFSATVHAGADKSTGTEPPPPLWDAVNSVNFAKKNNPDIAVALKRIEEAEASLSQAQAVNFPLISLSGEYSQTDNPMYSFGNILNQGDFDTNIDFNDPGRTDNLRLQTTILYQLYNGGQNRADIAVSASRIRLQQIELEGTHRRLGFEVVKTYQAILQANKMVQVRQQAVDAISAAYNVGLARYEAGDLLKQDILNLELQQARAEENLIQSQHQLELTKRTFLNLLGLKDGRVALSSKEAPAQIIPTGINYKDRHELKLLKNAEEIAAAELSKAKGKKYPTIDAFANYQIDQGFITDENGASWMAGVKMNYVLYDGKNRAAQIQKAQLRLQEIKALQQKTELALNLEVQQAKLNFQQTEKRLAVTEKMVNVAEEVARLSRARFKEGVILASDLIDFEMRLSDARLRYLSAATGHRVAIANLRRVAGLDQFPEI